MITYRQSNLNGTIIEACSCLCSWYGNPDKSEGDKFDDEGAIEVAYNQVRERMVEEGSEDLYQHLDVTDQTRREVKSERGSAVNEQMSHIGDRQVHVRSLKESQRETRIYVKGLRPEARSTGQCRGQP